MPNVLNFNAKSLGQYFTKPEVVTLMLDLFDYVPSSKLFNLSILEPAAGDGVFLFSIVDRLFESCKMHNGFLKNGSLKAPVFSAAKEAIVAVELDENTYTRLIHEVQNYLIEKGLDIQQSIDLSESWLVHSDFLLWNNDYIKKFDFVVGNPPYIRNENLSEELKKKYKSLFPTYYDRADIYVPFIEHSLLMLKEKGICSFICTDRFIKNKYGCKLRKFITESYQVNYFLDIHNSSPFEEDVSAYPCIFGFSKSSVSVSTHFAKADQIDKKEITALKNFVLFDKPNYSITTKILDEWFKGEEPWVIDFDVKEILDVIKARFPTINDVNSIDCKIGIATGATDLYVLDKELVEEYDLEKELLIPLITKEHLTPEGIEWNGTYTIQTFESNGKPIELEKYPNTRSYFLQFKERLSKRAFVKKAPHKWFCTKEKIRIDEIEKQKIIWKDIGNSTKFFEEKGCYYPEHSLYYLLVDGYDSRLLKHVLNSFVSLAFVKAYSTSMRGDYFRFQKQNIEQICIPLEVNETIIKRLDKANELDKMNEFNDIIATLFGLNDKQKNILLNYVGFKSEKAEKMNIKFPDKDTLAQNVFECVEFYKVERAKNVRSGNTMKAFEKLIVQLLTENGVAMQDIKIGTSAVVPGYFRGAKNWDVLIKKSTDTGDVLIGLIEFKSLKGASGKNINNRSEEAIGSAYDFYKANEHLGITSYNEDKFVSPFLGYVFLVGADVKNADGKNIKSPWFDIDPVFKHSDDNPMSYLKRFELLSYRLKVGGLYSETSLLVEQENGYSEPSEPLEFYNFVIRMLGDVVTKYHTIK